MCKREVSRKQQILYNKYINNPSRNCSFTKFLTTGFGMWGRQFGRFNSHVASFDIVLSDGSLVTVNPPQKDATTKVNDDIWHAVLGGASSSFGVVGIRLSL
jgi:FAD/FMN-containing dehydrogenase